MVIVWVAAGDSLISCRPQESLEEQNISLCVCVCAHENNTENLAKGTK